MIMTTRPQTTWFRNMLVLGGGTAAALITLAVLTLKWGKKA